MRTVLLTSPWEQYEYSGSRTRTRAFAVTVVGVKNVILGAFTVFTILYILYYCTEQSSVNSCSNGTHPINRLTMFRVFDRVQEEGKDDKESEKTRGGKTRDIDLELTTDFRSTIDKIGIQVLYCIPNFGRILSLLG